MTQAKPTDPRDKVAKLLQLFTTTSDDLNRAFGSRHGLHHTAVRAIVELMASAERGTPMTAGRLGVALDLSPASVTALVDRMVATRHVRREPDPTDRRRVLLMVEPDAVELGEQFFGPLAHDLTAMMIRYSDDDLELIQRFLTDTIRTIDSYLARSGQP